MITQHRLGQLPRRWRGGEWETDLHAAKGQRDGEKITENGED